MSLHQRTRRISIKAKPGAKIAVITEKNGRLVVAVKERAADGKANRAIEKAIAKYFGVAPARVRIVAGHTAREKVVEIAAGKGV
jgi:uncharacterized protein (TIGR00251 family)